MLAGSARSDWPPPAVAGRLAELYLQSGPAAGHADRALELAERGLAMVAPGDPLYPKLLHVTAAALRAVTAPPAGSLGRDGRAARLDRDAWLLSLDPVPLEAVGFARQWGDWAWDREAWDEAAEAYAGAALALSRIVRRSTVGIQARLDLLSQHGYLAPRSAFAYARTEQGHDAVVVLERAGDLLCAVGSQRQDLDRLSALGRPDLRDQLLAAVGSAASQAAPPDVYGHLPAGQQQAQQRADALVREIRAVPGLAGFARPPGWDEVSAAAQFRAISYLAATDKGTVVLTVLPGAGGIARTCLPWTQDDIWSQFREFFRAEYGTGTADPGDALMPALEWLSRIMISVVQSVGGDSPVLLVPFGLLAQLPLQAAWAALPGQDGGPARTHFWFHPSHVAFASSARSWLGCRERAGLDRGAGTLVVNNPAPLDPALDQLLLSDYERDAVARHLPVTELAGRDATAEAILGALPGVSAAHLSCHGSISKQLRYTGVLHVADERLLTVLDWDDSPALNARLIFLSACSTGLTAQGVAQLTSAATALVSAGAAGVIAAFWHTEEMATLLIVTRFYDLWRGGRGAGPAEALGQAQDWLATSPAAVLRAAVPPAALQGRAGRWLAGCPPDERPYIHPWYWAPFFLLGT